MKEINVKDIVFSMESVLVGWEHDGISGKSKIFLIDHDYKNAIYYKYAIVSGFLDTCGEEGCGPGCYGLNKFEWKATVYSQEELIEMANSEENLDDIEPDFTFWQTVLKYFEEKDDWD